MTENMKYETITSRNDARQCTGRNLTRTFGSGELKRILVAIAVTYPHISQQLSGGISSVLSLLMINMYKYV